MRYQAVDVNDAARVSGRVLQLQLQESSLDQTRRGRHSVGSEVRIQVGASVWVFLGDAGAAENHRVGSLVNPQVLDAFHYLGVLGEVLRQGRSLMAVV